jgi:4-hydroxybenzoate polyprenyltransferase
MKKSTLLHLRIPFSFFLMPVFWFALSAAHTVSFEAALFAFVSLHFFAYPASNGFNSYYDKDEGSIGGLEKPPPVTNELLFVSLFAEGLGIFMALFVSLDFAIAVFLYGLASKAYSYDKIRLKKYPIISLLTVGFFQGAFIFIAVYQAVTKKSWTETLQIEVLLPALLNSLMLIGSYPMTQIYQHEEDAKRGDLTMSRLLGIRGTFAYTALLFGGAIAGLSYYFWQFGGGFTNLLVFHLALLPTLIFFLYWFAISYKDASKANFKNTMLLNLVSALCTNFCFILFFYWKHLAI